MNFGAPELIIVLLIVLLVFGSTKLPKLARSLGQAQKEFKDGLKEGAQTDDADSKAADSKAADSKAADNKPSDTTSS
jgi:sec-independent protein translocase protein TatA